MNHAAPDSDAFRLEAETAHLPELVSGRLSGMPSSPEGWPLTGSAVSPPLPGGLRLFSVVLALSLLGGAWMIWMMGGTSPATFWKLGDFFRTLFGLSTLNIGLLASWCATALRGLVAENTFLGMHLPMGVLSACMLGYVAALILLRWRSPRALSFSRLLLWAHLLLHLVVIAAMSLDMAGLARRYRDASIQGGDTSPLLLIPMMYYVCWVQALCCAAWLMYFKRLRVVGRSFALARPMPGGVVACALLLGLYALRVFSFSMEDLLVHLPAHEDWSGIWLALLDDWFVFHNFPFKPAMFCAALALALLLIRPPHGRIAMQTALALLAWTAWSTKWWTGPMSIAALPFAHATGALVGLIPLLYLRLSPKGGLWFSRKGAAE